MTKECPPDKVLNPLTKRCIKKPKESVNRNLELSRIHSPKQHYFLSDFIKDSKKEKIFKESPKLLDKRLSSLIKFKKAKIVQRFMKNKLIIKRFDIDSRIKYYKYITSFINNINDESCLKSKIFIWKNNKETHGYTINDVIDLEKQIGTESANAVIYKTSIKNMIGTAPIAAKLMTHTSDNLKEISINKMVTKDLVLNKESRHFLITYKVLKCFSNKLLNNSLPKIIQKRNYYITLNELAHGDLKHLVNTRNLLSEDEMKNIFVQTMLSIATFHCLKYVHRDCHWGNFLYQEIKNKSGVYHYKINNGDYYVKNCGYNIMIYDFGYAEKHSAYQTYKPESEDLEYLIDDYIRVSWAFKNMKWGGWSDHSDYPSDNISKTVSSFTNSLNKYLRHNYELNNNKEDYTLNSFISILRGLLIFYFPSIISKTIPNGENIINIHPYSIDINP